MSFDLFFILIVIPFIIGSIFLVVAQRKFFDRYHKVFHPKDPVSMVDFGQLLQNNPQKAYKFIKGNFFEFFFLGWKVYLKKYEDSKLKRYAFLIKLFFIILLSIPLFGILLILLNA